MQPTDDANFFFEWLKNTPPDSLTGVKFGVFGCGHPDWVATYHHIPMTIDKLIHDAGGTRIIERGLANSAEAELFDEFNDWESRFLNSISDSSADTTPTLSVTIDTNHREKVLKLDPMYTATVVSNDVISNGTEYNPKRHIEIRLSEGMSYKTGDYLNILPTNPDKTVKRVLKRFNLHPDDLLTIKGEGRNLPVDTPISAKELLGGFVELAQPATRRQIEALTVKMVDGEKKGKLQRLTDKQVHEEEIVARRVSLLDLLEANPEIKMDLGEYLLSLPPLRIRQVRLSPPSHLPC
jgi:cytochrome P450/NADPH-cytochrome P450 reductase